MRPVVAQFKRPWRPGRALLVALALLTAVAFVAVGGVVFEQRRVAALRGEVAQLVEADRGGGTMPAASHPVPPYDASARQFLRERAAGWAPMLRTLESGAMIGVTPSTVEFNATDGTARVTLNYADSTALLDYLGRINEGVSAGEGLARWTLVETRLQPGGLPNAAPAAAGLPPSVVGPSVATIRSVW